MIGKVLCEMIGYFAEDARRINHALKVYGFAQAIAEGLNLSENDFLTVQLAAILHDIGIKEAERKYGSSDGKYQEIEGPAIAAGIMSKVGVESAIQDRVCFLVGNHHSYSKIDNTDFRILVEADFLVNIHEDQMDQAAVRSIRGKYFKTPGGIRIIEGLYNLRN